jgi:3-oxoacyl-[acyl-carrier-protein] synthase II
MPNLDNALRNKVRELTPQVDTSGLSAYIPAKALRQCDRFSRLALLGACAAMEDAGIAFSPDGPCLEGIGIVLASGYGTSTPTLDFLDSILDFGESMASPLAFSLSVHNIPAAIIAKSMQILGPCAAICLVENPVASGLLLARDWLEENRVERVLFGAVDEITPSLVRTTERLIAEQQGRPEYLSRKDRPVTEGACFFVLSKSGNGRGRIDDVLLEFSSPATNNDACLPKADAYFMSGAISPEERTKHNAFDGGSAYGNLPIAQAFDCIAALALLQGNTMGRVCSMHQDKGSRGIITISREGA